jgi:hypothetical protein
VLACVLASVFGAEVRAQAEALVMQARDVQDVVAEIRGLPFLHPVRMSVQDRQAIRAYAVSRLDREYSPEDFRAKAESLIAWGFVRRPFDLRSLYEELFAEQIGGYYDPFEGVFFIADWLPPLLQKPIMAHELTHALQDQHFDLEPLLRGVEANDDASLAGAAVVEGEGLAVMIDYALRPVGISFESVPDLRSMIDTQLTLNSGRFRIYANAPPIVKETLLFPYLQGLLFIRAAKVHGGWESISHLYTALPASTEQVLWPEKYFERRDQPTPVQLPDVARLLGHGWKRIDSNVLGELGNRVVLQSYGETSPRSTEGAAVEEDDAAPPPGADAFIEAARGWDGDRYELYERKRGETALVSVSIWDADEEAEEFERAWQRLLASTGRPAGSHRVLRRGPLVLGLLNVPSDRMTSVLEALLAAAPTVPVS